MNALEPAIRLWPHREVVPMADVTFGRKDRIVLLIPKWREDAVPHMLPEIRDAIGLDSEVVRHWWRWETSEEWNQSKEHHVVDKTFK